MAKSIHSDRQPRRRLKKRAWRVVVPIVAAVVLAGGLVVFSLCGHRQPLLSSSDEGSSLPVISGPSLPKTFIDQNTFSSFIAVSNITAGTSLYTKNADQRAYPASMTKLMTALVAVDNSDINVVYTVGNEVYMIEAGSSRAWLTVGMQLTLENLLEAMLLPSGNDAAYVTAVQIGRVIAGNPELSNQEALNIFVGKMNEKAAALGCTATHFANPDGMDRDDHYTTAADMLKIATCAVNQPDIIRITAMQSVNETLPSGHTVSWQTSNKLIREDSSYYFSGATGLKTGSTDNAGYCLAASATRDGQTVVAIVMGAQQEWERWEDARGLMDICFQ